MLLVAIAVLLILMVLGSVAWFRLSRNAAVGLAASLWVFYVPYEYLMYRRILCSGECNIRVDLLVIYPVLLLVTLAAIGRLLWSWRRPH
jgi:hypothetical protein